MEFPDKTELNNILEKIRLLIKCDKNSDSPPEILLWRTVVQSKDVNNFKKHFNNLRLIYSNMLINFILEECENLCYPKKVGNTKPSVSSDIDIELVFNIPLLRDKMEKISSLYKSINKFHHYYFHNSFKYNELFDINIYASRFINTKKTREKCTIFDKNISQRLWSISRCIELVPDILLIIPKDNNIFIQNINDCLEMLKDIPSKKTDDEYINQLYNYFDILIKNKDSDDEILLNKAANAFSLTKYYEDDTYMSIGAYLHIVTGDQNLSKNLYMDSFMDNFGFALDNLFTTNQCINIPLQWKILRIAKYMERMLDALLLIDKNYKSSYDLNKLKNLSTILNDQRKRDVEFDNRDLIINIDKFMKELHITSSSYSEDEIKTALFGFVCSHYDLD